MNLARMHPGLPRRVSQIKEACHRTNRKQGPVKETSIGYCQHVNMLQHLIIFILQIQAQEIYEV